jgi:hypothetical protein
VAETPNIEQLAAELAEQCPSSTRANSTSPELIGATALVTSRCPTTARGISLTVMPHGPSDLRPTEAVVSLLLPDGPFDATVIERFCHFVHFFASPEAAAKWTAEHPGTFTLSVKAAYQLGRLTNRAAWGSAMTTGARR